MANKKADPKDGMLRALESIEKSFGAGSLMNMGKVTKVDIDCISSGSLSIDFVLGGKGFPRGRICEIFGPESSGKTTIALHVAREAIRHGGKAVIIDMEHAIDLSWAKKIGCDLNNMYLAQPSGAEEALSLVDVLAKENACDLIVLDSVASLVPRPEVDGNMGDSHIGLQARLMSQACRKLVPTVADSKAAVLFINQIRINVGQKFGNPETTPGGNALRFASTIRLDVRAGTKIQEGEEIIGNAVRVTAVKNKIANPRRKREADLYYGKGFCFESDIVKNAIETNVLDKSGNWLSYKDIKLGNGKEAARVYLKEHHDLAMELRDKVLAAWEKRGSE